MPFFPSPHRYCVFEDSRTAPDAQFLGGAGLLLDNPVRTIKAEVLDAVVPALGALQSAAEDGLYAAGYVAYEAAAAFGAEFAVHANDPALPLLEFDIFEDATPLSARGLEAFWRSKTLTRPSGALERKKPALSAGQYEAAIDAIKDYLAAGDIYQANYTFPIALDAQGSAESVYARLRRSQPSAFSSFLALGERHVLSVSPEQFFQRQGDAIATQPMKGTLPTSPGNSADALQSDPKNRAENLMITDLLRNDLSRIAIPGSVAVSDLFAVMRLPSVFQMTSTITAALKEGTSLADIFAALFPCGSITGAPKVRAMEIIRALEQGPRGIYCGAIGLIKPGGDASFCVPIRTVVDTPTRTQVNVGSGIVADSTSGQEFGESLLKAEYLTSPAADFALIETLAFEARSTAFTLPPLWPWHIARLRASAEDLGFAKPDETQLAGAFEGLAETLSPGQYKVRLLYARRGDFTLSAEPLLSEQGATVFRLRRGRLPQMTAQSQMFLRYKTSLRWFYADALAAAKTAGACDDVLLVDDEGMVQEGSYTNIFVQDGDSLITPPATGALLPGVLRQQLLDTGAAKEAPLHISQLESAQGLFIGNAVRGLKPAQLVD
ncbi:MAG: aminodeoxychorismate synthase component I [Pseudomonadota bacterium]